MHLHPILSALLRSKTGAALIVAQVALTLAIVCNALFVIDARLATAARPSGVDDAGVFQLTYYGIGTIPDPAAMMQRDLEVLKAIPGVIAAADVNSFPISRSGWNMGLSADPTRAESVIGAGVYFSGESVVDAFGLRLVEGRDFEPADVRELTARNGNLQADTVILSRHLARLLLPDEATVVGKTIHLGAGADAHPMRVVGVVDTLMSSSGQASPDAHRAFILPVRYFSDRAQYAVRTAPADRARVMAEAEKALTALRKDRVLTNHRSMSEIRETRYRQENAGANMLIAVVVGLLVVTAGGIVGVSSIWVSQRRKQIGVRRALGARRSDILRYFLSENLLITTTGIVLGVGLALGLNQYLVSHVELARLPPGYIVAGVPAMWALGVIAVLGPAWRAAAVPPAVATRTT